MKEGQRSDFAIYGTGVVLWFQFLKYMAWIFFIMLVLSVPMAILYREAGKATEMNKENRLAETGALKQQAVSFTTGNIKTQKTAPPACIRTRWRSEKDTQYVNTGNFTCNVGNN